jgi:hypothetical protein
MYWVTRKMTGKIVGRNVPQEALEAYLSTLPSGVYGVEDSQGKETEVTVKSGRVSTGS